MQKTYWWRAVFVIAIIILYLIGGSLGSAVINGRYYSNPYFDFLTLFSILCLVISPFIFFIDDTIFLKWLIFATIWLLVTLIFFAIALKYEAIMSYVGLDKENISIFMGILFFISSFAKMILDSWKQALFLGEVKNNKSEVVKKLRWFAGISLAVIILFFVIIYIVNSTLLNGIM